MVACTGCQTTYPTKEGHFNRQSAASDGFHSQCKQCTRAATARWETGRGRQVKQEWRRQNRSKVLKAIRKQQLKRSADPEYREQARQRSRNWRRENLKAKYGITAEQYDAQYARQEGKCAICRLPESGVNPRTGQTLLLAVDHCHASGQVRGLLCGKCNKALGLVNDDVDRLEKMAEYLRRAGVWDN